MMAKAKGPEGTSKNAVTQPQNNTVQLAIIARFENRAFKGSTSTLLDAIKSNTHQKHSNTGACRSIAKACGQVG